MQVPTDKPGALQLFANAEDFRGTALRSDTDSVLERFERDDGAISYLQGHLWTRKVNLAIGKYHFSNIDTLN